MRSFKILSLLALMLLTTRGFAATYIVDNNTIDLDNGLAYFLGDGNTTLRKAIRLANANSGKDTILFNLIAPKIIVLTIDLPPINDPIYIDGAKEVEIDNDNHIGIRLVSTAAKTSAGSEIKNLIIYDGQYENLIVEKGALATDLQVNNIIIQGCNIGTNAIFSPGLNDGAGASDGIRITNVGNVLIGGANPTERNFIMHNDRRGIQAETGCNDLKVINNVISGNGQNGIYCAASSAISIRSNLIGVGADLITSIPNLNHGIELNSVTNSIIGGLAANERNVINNNGFIADGIGVNAHGGSNNLNVLNNIISGNKIGVEIDNSDNCIIKGNIIGLESDGFVIKGNRSHGIEVSNGSDNTIIGGSVSADRNIISSNGSGINIENNCLSTVIKGNYIGTTIDGSLSRKNGFGIQNNGNSHNTIIGGNRLTEGNIIAGNGSNSGNSDFGINVDFGSNNVIIKGNLIGTDVTGKKDFGHFVIGVIIKTNDNIIGDTANNEGNTIVGTKLFNGILIANGNNNTVRGNRIGIGLDDSAIPNTKSGINISVEIAGQTASDNIIEYNTIAYNLNHGINIGDALDEKPATGGLINNQELRNTIRRNSIFCNTNKGIFLNLADNTDWGNNGQPTPAIDATLSTESVIKGITNSALAGDSLEIFLMDNTPNCANSCDVNPQGKTYLTSIKINSDGSWSYDNGVPIVGKLIATATDAIGNTSEFSLCYNPCYLEAKANAIPTLITLNNTNTVKVDLVSTESSSVTGLDSIAWFLTTPDGVTELYAEKDTIITFQNKTAFDAGLYEISLVIYSGGCRDTAKFTVDVEYFFIPNLLTPNGDNLNDKFLITSTDKYNIEIFNRWGNCIYKKEGYADEWDLQDVSDGIYYYNITDSRASDKQYKGWVHVVSNVQ
jgi:gliding motility-associated-like protein